MSLSASDRREFLATLAAMTDRKLGEEQLAALRELVKSDDEARRLYVEYQTLDALLHWSIDKEGTESAGTETEKVLAEIASQADQRTTERTAGRRTASAQPRVLHLRWSPKWIAIAASLLLIGYFASVASLLMFARLRSVDRVAENSDARENLFATVRSAENSKWRNSAKNVVGGEALGGRLLQVEQGFTELEFAGGARVVVEGPAEFEVRSATSGFLHRGRLTAEVNARAVGFSIETPTARIVDRGTEFGVQVDEQGETEVHTFIGVVEVADARPSAEQTERRPQRVTAGQAVRVGVTTRIESISANRERFARVKNVATEPIASTRPVLPHDAAPRPDASEYGRLVLAARPLLYYSLDQLENVRVMDLGTALRHGQLHGVADPKSSLVEGRVGQALQLHGDRLSDYVMVANYPPSPNGQLSASVWVKAWTAPAGASIAKNWGNSEEPGQFHLGLKQDTGILEVEIRLANRDKVSLAEASGTPLPLGVWQHVAFVADGQQLRLYRNGKEVAQALCGSVIANPEIRSLGVGVKPLGVDNRPDNANPGYWDGLIDELAVYDYPLTAEMVRQLALRADEDP